MSEGTREAARRSGSGRRWATPGRLTNSDRRPDVGTLTAPPYPQARGYVATDKQTPDAASEEGSGMPRSTTSTASLPRDQHVQPADRSARGQRAR